MTIPSPAGPQPGGHEHRAAAATRRSPHRRAATTTRPGLHQRHRQTGRREDGAHEAGAGARTMHRPAAPRSIPADRAIDRGNGDAGAASSDRATARPSRLAAVGPARIAGWSPMREREGQPGEPGQPAPAATAAEPGAGRPHPSSGPMVNAAPTAIPSRPIAATRRSAGVRSAASACATPMLPPHAPASSRAATSHPTDGASAIAASDRHEPGQAQQQQRTAPVPVRPAGPTAARRRAAPARSSPAPHPGPSRPRRGRGRGTAAPGASA